MEVLRRLLTGGLGRPPWDLPGRRQDERFLLLVRAGATGDAGGGLSVEGQAQAEAMADALAALGPLPVTVAPERASVETAAALEDRWACPASVEPALAALDLPAGSRWSELGADAQAWRRDVLAAVGALGADGVVVAGPEVVAAVVGAATGDDAVDCAQVRPGSRTTLRLEAGGLRLLRLDQQGASDAR